MSITPSKQHHVSECIWATTDSRCGVTEMEAETSGFQHLDNSLSENIFWQKPNSVYMNICTCFHIYYTTGIYQNPRHITEPLLFSIDEFLWQSKKYEIITNFLRNAANALTNSCWLTSLTLTPWPRICNKITLVTADHFTTAQIQPQCCLSKITAVMSTQHYVLCCYLPVMSKNTWGHQLFVTVLVYQSLNVFCVKMLELR